MITSKLKKSTLSHLATSGGGAIVCSVCKLPGKRSRSHARNFNSASHSRNRALTTDKFFDQQVCANCVGFWIQKTKERTKPDTRRWEICERIIFKFFERRNVLAARTLTTGPDVVVNLFGAVFRVEVKGAVLNDDTVHGRLVGIRRTSDDVVAVVLPDDRIYWLPMKVYLENCNRVGFSMQLPELERNYRYRFFEQAIQSAALLRGLDVRDFRLIEPWRQPSSNSPKILRRRQK